MFNIIFLASLFFNQALLPDHPSLTYSQRPAWVKEVKRAVRGKHPSQEGVQLLLYDQQVNLETNETYIHVSKKVLEGGIEECSQIGMEFDPSYQSLAVHEIGVYRDGKRIDTPLSKEAHLLQEGESLIDDSYDCNLDLFFLLHDLHEGDIVEIAYTLSGQDTTLDGHFCDSIELSFPFQVEKIYYRCLRSTDTPLQVTVHNSDVVPEERYITDSLIETAVTVSPSFISDDGDTPNRYLSTPWLQASTFLSWQEVSEWGKTPFQANRQEIDEEIQALLSTWSESTTSKNDLVLRALSFVQNEPLYFGSEQDIYSPQPHVLREAISKSDGDEKEKILIFKCFMDAIGVASTPCFVHTDYKQAIRHFNPSLAAFNHVLLKVDMDGEEYFLDPTEQYQGGGLKERSQDYFRCYLPQGSDGLKMISAQSDNGSLDITRHFSLQAANGQLAVSRIVKGENANLWRALLAHHGQEGITGLLLDDWASLYDHVTIHKPIKVKDNLDTNQIQLVSIFDIEKLLVADDSDDKTGFFDLQARSILEHLPEEVDMNRTTPLAISHPVKIHETLRISSPEPSHDTHHMEVIEHPAFIFKYEQGTEGGDSVLEYSYETKSDHVAIADLQDFKHKIESIEALCFNRCHASLDTNILMGPLSTGAIAFLLGVIIVVAAVSITSYLMFRQPTAKDLRQDIKKKWKKAFLICFIVSLLAVCFVGFFGIHISTVWFTASISILVRCGIAYLLFARSYKRNGTILIGIFCFVTLFSILNPLNIYLLIRNVQLFRYNRAMKKGLQIEKDTQLSMGLT